MIIDFSAHFISREVGKVLEQEKFYGPGKYFPFPPENADPEERIRLMDNNDIEIQVLTQTSPVLLGFDAKKAAKICRMSNDAIFDLCEEYPNRFIGFGILSLLDINTALIELNRIIHDLSFQGVTFSTNQNGKPLDSPDFDPIYKKIVEYNVPIFLHPTNWESYPIVDMEQGFRIMHIFGWPFDTTQAIIRMILGGTLEKFPSLKIVTHHLGGMIPYFRRRFEVNAQSFLKEHIKRPLSNYFECIYGDTALDGDASALACGYDFFGPNRIVFGTDYPFGPENGEVFIKDNLKNIKEMNIPQENKQKILEKNARKLLDL